MGGGKWIGGVRNVSMYTLFTGNHQSSHLCASPTTANCTNRPYPYTSHIESLPGKSLARPAHASEVYIMDESAAGLA